MSVMTRHWNQVCHSETNFFIKKKKKNEQAFRNFNIYKKCGIKFGFLKIKVLIWNYESNSIRIIEITILSSVFPSNI